jgi:transposase
VAVTHCGASVKQSDIDNGRKDGQTADERAQINAMEREIRELRQANEILRKISALTLSLEPVAFLRPTLRPLSVIA